MPTINSHSSRNFPPPIQIPIYTDCGISARTEVVANICKKVNELNEFITGYDAHKVLVPAQGNCDERMPLTFLRPCIDVINALIATNKLETESIPQVGSNIDYHGFIPLCRTIAKTINSIIGEWAIYGSN